MADDVPVIHFAPGTFKGSVVRLPAATGQNWQVMVSGFGQVERITLEYINVGDAGMTRKPWRAGKDLSTVVENMEIGTGQRGDGRHAFVTRENWLVLNSPGVEHRVVPHMH